MMNVNNHQYQKNKKLSKVLTTKLSIEDYNASQMLTKVEYQAGLIKEESTTELLRFTIRHILNQVSNDQIYRYLKTRTTKKARSNNQQLHQFTLQSNANNKQ
jgi:hypothetical protein